MVHITKSILEVTYLFFNLLIFCSTSLLNDFSKPLTYKKRNFQLTVGKKFNPNGAKKKIDFRKKLQDLYIFLNFSNYSTYKSSKESIIIKI